MKYLIAFCFLNFMLVGPYSSYGQNPIAHYPFDNNTIDVSGNKNDGVIFNGVTGTSDRFGNPCGALKFNGIDGYIEVPTSYSLQSPIQSFSLTCWFKIDNRPSNNGIKWLTIICKGNQTIESISNPQYRVQTFQSNSQSTISINTEFTEFDDDFKQHSFEFDKWYFYALVYDGRFVKTFLNNSLTWEFPFNQSLSPNNEPLYIGKDMPGALEFFSGSLDDLRIYNKPLNENEISELYNEISTNTFDDEFTLACPNNILANTTQGDCYATINYPDPILKISCGSPTLKQIGGLISGSRFPVGTSIVTFEAKSHSGFKKTCSMKITVIDKEQPIINCRNDTILLINNESQKSVKYNYQFAYAKDNCTINDIRLISGLPSGSEFPIGTTEVKFLATDKSGNSSECGFKVIVRKTSETQKTEIIFTKDTFKCPQNISVHNDSHNCGAVVNYSLNHGSEIISLEEGQESGTFFPIGTTICKYHNTKTNDICLFSVTVVDNEKPELLCQNDTIVYTNNSAKSVKVNYSIPLAIDNCGIDSIIQILGKKSGELFPLGNTLNVFKAFDVHGNFTTCSFKIIVVDTNIIRQNDTLTNVEFKPNLIPDSIRYIKHPLEFKTCIITIVLYDDGQQDFDTISVFFNKKEIVNKELLKNKKNGVIIRSLMLNPGEKNDLIIKAWNNGNISPNTLKIEFFEGYYFERKKQLKNKKPINQKIMHSKPGVAAAIYLNCIIN